MLPFFPTGQSNTVKQLVNAGADVDHINNYDCSILEQILESSMNYIVKVLF